MIHLRLHRSLRFTSHSMQCALHTTAETQRQQTQHPQHEPNITSMRSHWSGHQELNDADMYVPAHIQTYIRFHLMTGISTPSWLPLGSAASTKDSRSNRASHYRVLCAPLSPSFFSRRVPRLVLSFLQSSSNSDLILSHQQVIVAK